MKVCTRRRPMRAVPMANLTCEPTAACPVCACAARQVVDKIAAKVAAGQVSHCCQLPA